MVGRKPFMPRKPIGGACEESREVALRENFLTASWTSQDDEEGQSLRHARNEGDGATAD